MAIQSFRPTRLVPPWLARMPASATLRNMEFLGSLSTPSASVPEVQKRFSTVRACVRMRDCSKNFMKKMYQVPADMMASSARTVSDTGLPFRTMSSMPYGLSLLAAAAGAAGAGVLTAGAGAGAAAGAGAGAAALLSPDGAAIVGSAGG